MDYNEWMDGEGGYRDWYAANVGDDDTASLKGAHTNLGGGGPPPPKPPAQP